MAIFNSKLLVYQRVVIIILGLYVIVCRTYMMYDQKLISFRFLVYHFLAYDGKSIYKWMRTGVPPV